MKTITRLALEYLQTSYRRDVYENIPEYFLEWFDSKDGKRNLIRFINKHMLKYIETLSFMPNMYIKDGSDIIKFNILHDSIEECIDKLDYVLRNLELTKLKIEFEAIDRMHLPSRCLDLTQLKILEEALRNRSKVILCNINLPQDFRKRHPELHYCNWWLIWNESVIVDVFGKILKKK